MFSWMDHKRAEALGWKFFKIFKPQTKKIPEAEKYRRVLIPDENDSFRCTEHP